MWARIEKLEWWSKHQSHFYANINFLTEMVLMYSKLSAYGIYRGECETVFSGWGLKFLVSINKWIVNVLISSLVNKRIFPRLREDVTGNRCYWQFQCCSWSSKPLPLVSWRQFLERVDNWVKKSKTNDKIHNKNVKVKNLIHFSAVRSALPYTAWEPDPAGRFLVYQAKPVHSDIEQANIPRRAHVKSSSSDLSIHSDPEISPSEMSRRK